jgi:hypothetical protein
MDAGAFVQENKKWLLGCGIGLVAWWIGASVIDSVYRVSWPSPTKLGGLDPVYDATALAAAKTENEQLQAERLRLQQALAFAPSEKYQAANKPNLDEYLLQVGRELKQGIAKAATQREVQLGDAAVAWEQPNNVDDRRNTLFGLELIDEAQKRLFAAHDATRAAAETAPGLRAILSLKLDTRRNQKNQMRGGKPGDADIRDFLTQEQVSLQFQSDEPTAAAFLESCRLPNRALVVDSWQMVKGARPGEPCTIKCVLLGIAFKEGK